MTRTERELQRLTPERACRDLEDVADLLRALGPLPLADVRLRCVETVSPNEIGHWLVELEGTRRVIRVRVAGEERWAAIEDAGRLRDALGCSMPVGVPQVFLESVPDPLGDLVARYARTHAPFSVPALAQWWGVGPAVVLDALRRLVSAGRVVEGELLPTENGGGAHGLDFCDAEVLRTLRRRSLAALRAEVEPVPAVELARFLPAWQGVGGGLRGREGLVRAVEQLAGAVVPASALETLVLPSRVVGYTPALLDELTSSGEVLWRGHGSLPGDDGWVSLHLGDTAHLTLPPLADGPPTASQQAVLSALAGGGAYFFRTLSEAVGSTDDEALVTDLWELVWAGRVANDTLAPLRALLAGGRTAHRRARSAPRSTRYSGRPWTLGALSGQRAVSRPALPTRSGPPTGAGRWSILPRAEADPTVRSYAAAEVLLDRYGVVTRGSVVAEGVPGGFAGVYRVLAAAEESGRVRRGYFVESLGAAQFAGTGAVDRLRAGARPIDGAGEGRPGAPALVLAATDPANAYGAALPWPPVPPRKTTAGRDTSPAARRAPWSCSSTATSSSTSSGAARPCCPGPTTQPAAERGRRARPLGPRGGAGPHHGREGRRRGCARLGPSPRAGPGRSRLPRHPSRPATAAVRRARGRHRVAHRPPAAPGPGWHAPDAVRPALGRAGHHRPPRHYHARGRQPGQARPAAARLRPDAALAPAHGGHVEGRGLRRADGTPAAPTLRSGRWSARVGGAPWACGWACWTCFPRHRRALWWAISAQTCSGRTGTAERASSNLAELLRHDRRGPARPAQPGRRRDALRLSESLFLERIHPWAAGPLPPGRGRRSAGERAHRLHRRRAAARRPEHHRLSAARAETAYVHGRSGRPCRRCGEGVRVAMIGRGATGPDDVLLPALPGRPRADRRRAGPAADGFGSARIHHGVPPGLR